MNNLRFRVAREMPNLTKYSQFLSQNQPFRQKNNRRVTKGPAVLNFWIFSLKLPVFRAADYLILKILTQIIEIIAVSGNPNDKVTVHLWILLGIPECFSADNIELDMVTVKTEIASDKGSKFLVTAFILKEFR
jgi:hypothetical protein